MPSERFKYAALGDSTAVGVGAGTGGGYAHRILRRLVDSDEKIAVMNLGQSGASSADLLAYQVPRLAGKRPDLITLGIGTNDLWRLVPLDMFRDNLTRIADAIAATGAEVVLTNIGNLAHAPAARLASSFIGIPPEAISARTEAMNAHLDALAARPGFHVVDMHGFTTQELPAHPEYFCPDGFHPSDLGYERWAALIWPEVEKVFERWRGRVRTGWADVP